MAIVTCPNCGAKNRVDESKAASAQPVCGKCKTPLIIPVGAAPSDGRPVTLTDATLTDALKNAGAKPVLVDVWAPWCGPCRRIAPVMDQLAAESGGKYVVAKMNVDENPRTATEYHVDAIPAMLLFKGGKLVEKIVGLQPKQAIAAKLAAHA